MVVSIIAHHASIDYPAPRARDDPFIHRNWFIYQCQQHHIKKPHINYLRNVFRHITQQRLNRPAINVLDNNTYRASVLRDVRRLVRQIHIVYSQEASPFSLQSEV